MGRLRTWLREGNGRIGFGYFFIPIVFAVLYIIFFLKFNIVLIKEIFRYTGTLIAILSITSYNLRCRTIDFTLKVMSRFEYPDMLKKCAIKTGNILTQMVLLSFISSIFLFICGILEGNYAIYLFYPFGVYIATACIIQYVYVIFGFERLEQFILNEETNYIKSQRTEKELRDIEQRKQTRPDSALKK